MERAELEVADYEYKRAVTAFLAEGGHDTLKAVADELARFNRDQTLIQEIASLRGSIDRMPRRLP